MPPPQKPPRRGQTTLGVDLRLVIIASLVVGMLLIQLVLVESYSGQAVLLQKNRDRYSHLFRAEHRTTTTVNYSDVAVLPMRGGLIRPISSSTQPEIDMESLERQLEELQRIHDGGGGEEVAADRAPVVDAAPLAPPPPPQTSSSSHPPPPPLSPLLQQHHLRHPLKGCRSRHHLLKPYSAPPAIVYFPPKDDDTFISVWRRVMVHELGFQLTTNPALATFVVSRMLISSHICPDSQLFNHLRGFKTALKTMVIWRDALVYSPSLTTTTTTELSKKQLCANFIARLDSLLRNASSTDMDGALVHAELVKGTIFTKQVSREDLRRMVDSYKKSPVCAMQPDETVRVKVFETPPPPSSVVVIATLPVYVASTRPWLVFAAPGTVTLRTAGDQQPVSSSLKAWQTAHGLSFSAMKRLLDGMKRKVGQAIQRLASSSNNKLLQDQLGTAGRFGYFAIEFLLVPPSGGGGGEFEAAMLRVVDHNRVELVREVVASQVQALKRTWFVAKPAKIKPEELVGLALFELCAYEKDSGGVIFFPFDR